MMENNGNNVHKISNFKSWLLCGFKINENLVFLRKRLLREKNCRRMFSLKDPQEEVFFMNFYLYAFMLNLIESKLFEFKQGLNKCSTDEKVCSCVALTLIICIYQLYN